MRIAVAALFVVLLGLSALNPGMDAFKRFTETHTERLLQHEAGDSALGQALAGAGGALAGALVGRVAERRNYLLFSTYTINLDGEDDEDDWRFLGIAGRFVEIQQPASLRERE